MAKKQTKKLEPQSESTERKLTEKPDIEKGETQTRFRVQFDVGYRGTPGKVMDQEGHTIPDMNLTVRQLMENHTRGIDDSMHAKQPLYFEHIIPRIEDITDVQKYKEYLEAEAEKVNEFIQQDLQNAEAKRQAAEQQSSQEQPQNSDVSID